MSSAKNQVNKLVVIMMRMLTSMGAYAVRGVVAFVALQVVTLAAWLLCEIACHINVEEVIILEARHFFVPTWGRDNIIEVFDIWQLGDLGDVDDEGLVELLALGGKSVQQTSWIVLLWHSGTFNANKEVTFVRECSVAMLLAPLLNKPMVVLFSVSIVAVQKAIYSVHWCVVV